jgi:hypothetical protein
MTDDEKIEKIHRTAEAMFNAVEEKHDSAHIVSSITFLLGMLLSKLPITQHRNCLGHIAAGLNEHLELRVKERGEE